MSDAPSTTPVLEITLPERPEEQVQYLTGIMRGMGKNVHHAYPLVLDGFEALGRDTRESCIALIHNTEGKSTTTGTETVFTANQARWMAGLVIFVHLNGVVTTDQAYSLAQDALFKAGSHPALEELEVIVNAVLSDDPMGTLLALGQSARVKREAAQRETDHKKAVALTPAEDLYRECEKFIAVHGMKFFLAHFGITLTEPKEQSE